MVPVINDAFNLITWRTWLQDKEDKASSQPWFNCDEAVEQLYLKIVTTFNHFCPIKNKTI